MKPSPALTHASQLYCLIDLDRIDEPANPMRDTMDEVQLAELAESIAKVGIIEPLVIEPAGDRYRVIAGHRRYLAAGLAKLRVVPCIVREPGTVDPAAVTIAENYYREDVNPAEEAMFLQKLLDEKCGNDMELLAGLIRHRVEYVDDRLLLLRGDARVLDALRERKITLAVARELNRTKDPGQRAVFTEAAISGGATASVVRTWRAQGDMIPAADTADAGAIADAGNAAAPVQAEPMRCFFCGESDEPHFIQVCFLHTQCRKFLQRLLDRANEAVAEGKG